MISRKLSRKPAKYKYCKDSHGINAIAVGGVQRVHIHRLVNTAIHTISDLLELARTDGGLQIEYASTELAAIVDEVVDDHRGMARERGVELSTETAPTPIVTDPQRVRQVLTNLVSNAIKYTPAGGNVRVSVVHEERPREREEVAGIEVRDSGPGIPADLQTKVFEEFFRVRNAGANGADGNGLGLAIGRRMARLLGGDITYVDGDGGGSVFTLWFPPSRAARTNLGNAPLAAAETGQLGITGR